MKTKNILLSIMALGTLSVNAFADYHGQDRKRDENPVCLREKWTLVKTEVKSPKTCEAGLDLQLAEGLFTYPLINVGPLSVRYWEGSFFKRENKKETYKHEYINICSGKVTYSSEETFENVHTRVFSMKNPNLDASIKESYKTAAMTDAEALKSYENLKIECESAL